MEERPRAVVCDDDPVARHLVSSFLAAAGFDVAAEVDVATDAVRVAEIVQPRVAVLDVALMGMSGIEAIPALKTVAADCAIVVFSSFDSVRAEALAAGADEVIDKTDPQALEAAIARFAPTPAT